MDALTRNVIIKGDQGLTYNGQLLKLVDNVDQMLQELVNLEKNDCNCKCQCEVLVCEESSVVLMRVIARNGHNELLAYRDHVKNIQDGE